MTDVRGIICDFLKANGYDGLVDVESECGCAVDDLVPCGEPFMDCVPAYRWTNVDCRQCAVLADHDSGCEWEGQGCFKTTPPAAEVTP